MSDGAEPHDTPLRAVELVRGFGEVELLPGGRVSAALDIAVVVDDVPPQGDGRPEGGFGYGVRRVARGVPDGDAQLSRGVEVDVVHARGGYADQAQPGECGERLAAHHDFVGDDDFGIAAAIRDLVRRGRAVTRVPAQLVQAGQVGTPEGVLVQKYDVRFHWRMCLWFCCQSISPISVRIATEAQPMPNSAGM